MKVVALKKFSLQPGCDFKKGDILNLSPKQFAEFSAVELVKELTKKEINDFKKKRALSKTGDAPEGGDASEGENKDKNSKEEGK